MPACFSDVASVRLQSDRNQRDSGQFCTGNRPGNTGIRKKNTSLTPQEELEKLSLTPQTTQCPICGGTDLKVTLASSEVQKGSMRAQKCIHYLYGEDYVSPLNLRVCDVCLSCTYPEDPWHGDCYDVPLGSSTVCHGYQ